MKFPSLLELSQQKTEVDYYPVAGRLDLEAELKLERDFHVKYFYLLDSQTLRSLVPQPSALDKISIEISNIQDVGRSQFVEFTLRTFFDRFASFYTKDDKEAFVKTSERYFSEKLFGRAYLKSERIVSLISTHKALQHPGAGSDALHIGYWGYDRSQVTHEESKMIKSDWHICLNRWSQENGSLPVDASVDYFNEPAFALVDRLGFELKSLRLDRRPR